MFKKILLAADLSGMSRKVAKGTSIADKNHAKLNVVYVLEYTPVVYGEGEFSIPVDSELMTIFEKNAKKALAQLGNDFGIPPERQYLEIGYVKKAIIDLAKKIHTDLIVIGSHGRHGVQLLLGFNC